jgi:ABC-type amino acid transport substrate-binding protein
VLTVYFSERPPFAFVEGQRGLILDVTKTILAEAGVRARFIELPPRRVLDLLRAGPPEALGVGWFPTPEGEVWWSYSHPIYQDFPLVALVNTRAAAALTFPLRLDALLSSGLTLGMQSGASFGPLVDRKIRTLGLIPLETMVDEGQLLRMVQGGRMDYTLLSEEEAKYLLDQDPSLSPGVVLTPLADPPPGNVRCFLYPAGFDRALEARIDAAIDRVVGLVTSSAAARSPSP